MENQKAFDCYECEEDDCDRLDDDPQSFICKNAIYCWKSTIRGEDNTERNARGCIGNAAQVRFMCDVHSIEDNNANRYRIDCCQGTLCNADAFPTLEPPQITLETGSSMSPLLLTAVILAPLLIVAVAILGMVVYYRRDKKCSSSLKKCCIEQLQEEVQQQVEIGQEAMVQSSSSNVAVAPPSYSSPPELKVTETGDSTIKEYFDGQSLTSGSGSGLPQLTQRTFAKQISLVEHLSRGRFGQPRDLWRGVWQGENVAVKIYDSRSEQLWARETEVYTRLLPSKHDHVLGYLGSDTTSVASCTQLWLVTHYHENGSLRGYLRRRRLEQSEMLRACLSFTRGLLYLHTEIHGTQGKVSVAHRNISSKNVFVRRDGSCVIADFGHAVTRERLEDETTLLFEYASKRYMSPEVLERTCNPRCLESFRQSDIYSLGLVFWEICRRCVSNEEEDVALDYAMPYSAMLPNAYREPTLEEMIRLVVIDQRRPELPEHWQFDETLVGMETIIKECWQTKGAARLPILRVKKMLIKLASNNLDVDFPLD